MSTFLLLIAALVFVYWLFGTMQPLANKPQVFLGATGGMWMLGLAILIALVALLV